VSAEAMTKTAIILPAVLALLALAPLPVTARDEVLIGVTSISAASAVAAGGPSSAPVVDPRLSQFAKNLRSLFAYTRYSFLGRSEVRARFGGTAAIQLPERFSLEVQPEPPKQDSEGRIEMTISLLREGEQARGGPAPGRGHPEAEVVLRTRIRLENGGTVLLGGPPIAGGVLILALTART